MTGYGADFQLVKTTKEKDDFSVTSLGQNSW